MEYFPENIKRKVYARSSGKCECERSTHEHETRCHAQIFRFHNIHFVHIDPDGPHVLSNCVAICEKCHAKILSESSAGS